MGLETAITPTKIYDVAEWQPGDCIGEYQFVYYHGGDGNVTAVPGQLAYLAASGTTVVPIYTVTQDVDTATAIKTNYSFAYGEFVSALTTGKYGWIKKKGPNVVAGLSDGSIDAGDVVEATSTQGQVKGTVVTTTAPAIPIGRAIAVDALTASPVGSIIWDFPGQD